MSLLSRAPLFLLLFHAFDAASLLSQAHAARPSLADQVNVMIGTAAEGQTFPATGVPFAMTQWTPQTRAGETKCIAPYYAGDTRIQGFRGSHFLSGSCAQDYGSFTLMPLLSDAALDTTGRSSSFSRATEHASPYRYAVNLDSGIHAEITGSQRSGMMEFRFPPGTDTGWLAVEDNLRLGHGTVRIDVARQEITGENPVYRIYAGSGEPAGFSGYVVVQFDRPFRIGGTWSGKERQQGSVEGASSGDPLGVYVSFRPSAQGVIRVRIGTSFTSIEEARRNLAAEMPDWNFEAVVARAHAAWDKALSPIQIAGDSPDRRIFYTALYHSMLAPRIANDQDGTYPRFASSIIKEGPRTETARGFTYYDDFSLWDTFRGVHPLFTIIDPDREREMIKSLIEKGKQGGFLPIFPAWNSYTAEMTGDHAGAVIADAYVKGIHDFDAEEALRLMKKNALELPATPELYREGQGRRALESYLKYGYIPLEDHVPYAFHGDEQVSRTLDYAFDDFELSVLAGALGHKEDAKTFAERAQNYRKVIDPEAGFARGRHADGTWVTSFEPTAKATYITESVPYVYTFFAPQDIPGLMEWLHGKQQFIAKLDGLFASGSYDHGNEPSHQIAYLYDDAGAPEKTQMQVHRIMSTLYKDGDGGLPGNDDAGQMSAWYVLSAMGFYPVTPGIPRNSIGTPRFDNLTLRLKNGHTFHIHAPGAEQGKFYIKSIRLNGVPIHRLWLLHSEIISGGNLEFEMSDLPPTTR
jgi:predicted alpha-1,2-mannosidase